MTSSIANETVDHSKNREPFSFYKFITNKYFLNVVSIVLFLALWDYVAKEKIFQRAGQGVAEDFFSRGPVPEREKGHNGHAIQEVRVGNQFIERKPSAFSRMVDGFVGNG